MIMAYASPHFNGRQLNNIPEIIPRVAYNGYGLLKNLTTFQVACVWRFPCNISVAWTCNMAYTIKFPAKNVYGNFHVTLWTKAADNLDHQVSIEISIHLLKQRICSIHFLPKESIEISMRCLNFFWTKFTDILYHRGVYRNFHVILIHLDAD